MALERAKHDGRMSSLPPDTQDFALVGLRSSKTAFIFASGDVFSPLQRVLVVPEKKGHTAFPPNILLFPDKKTKGGAYVSRRLLYHDTLEKPYL